tara:strand:- start:105 stop:362 length:258 start_codon:yes stop_codon:yes gene_type:complete
MLWRGEVGGSPRQANGYRIEKGFSLEHAAREPLRLMPRLESSHLPDTVTLLYRRRKKTIEAIVGDHQARDISRRFCQVTQLFVRY